MGSRLTIRQFVDFTPKSLYETGAVGIVIHQPAEALDGLGGGAGADPGQRLEQLRKSVATVALAVELVGSFAQKEGMEELLWRVAMLPEFQWIY